MRKIEMKVALSVAVIGLQLGCTKTVVLKEADYSTVYGRGETKYRIEMKTGEVHVVTEFGVTPDEIVVTKFGEIVGDVAVTPTVPYSLPLTEIERVEAVRFDGKKTLVVVVASAVLGFILAGVAVSSSIGI